MSSTDSAGRCNPVLPPSEWLAALRDVDADVILRDKIGGLGEHDYRWYQHQLGRAVRDSAIMHYWAHRSDGSIKEPV